MGPSLTESIPLSLLFEHNLIYRFERVLMAPLDPATYPEYNMHPEGWP